MMMSDEGNSENYKIYFPVNDAVIATSLFMEGDEFTKLVQSFGK